MNGVTVSTHVLHLGSGRPAAGVGVRLEPGGHAGSTDADGRLRFDVELAPGTYRLAFDLGAVSKLYASATLEVRLTEARHHHLPVLVSPFGLTTYRGS